MNGAEERGPTLDKSLGAEMDLVNRPNPWLPAYGFQLQHHANYQPTHEDLRANDTMLVQQVDFLETILEETSDDLQSDSDRSGTTYWLGSDSETESVIHIKNGQRIAEEKQDGSGSECNSVVPKKRRRKNGSESRPAGGGGSSPRSSSRDSSASSRSSSLLQFESLERTCATLSPSGYSFDSLEYAQQQQRTGQPTPSNGRSSRQQRQQQTDQACASPDSLEFQDYGQLNGYLPDLSRDPGDGLFGRLRPYRSFESLGEKDLMGRDGAANGFAAHAFGKNCDLSRLARRPSSRRRNPWQLNDADGYSDYDDSSENLSSPDEEEEEEEEEDEEEGEHEYASTRYNEVDQLLVFGEQCAAYSHTAALDCRNSVDLRDFGLDSDDEEKRRENTLLELKATSSRLGPSYASLDDEDYEIEPGVQLRRRHHHHHHHHKSPVMEQQQQQPSNHHHHHRRSAGSGSLQYAEQRSSGCIGSGAAGNSGSGPASSSSAGCAAGSGFNFRFADTWRSAPSLPGSLLESAAAPGSRASLSSLLLADERYTRVNSVPLGLDLCGRSGSLASDTLTAERHSDGLPDDDDDDDAPRASLDLTGRSAELDSRSGGSGSSEEEEVERSGSLERRMADVMTLNHEDLLQQEEEEEIVEPGKIVGEEKARLRKRAKEQLSPSSSSVKIQDGQSSGILKDYGAEALIRAIDDDFADDEDENGARSLLEEKPVPTSTVKTQDHIKASVLEQLALAMEGSDVDASVDEAIKQLRREVEEATGSSASNVAELAAALENAERVKRSINEAAAGSEQQSRIRFKNNASYELAQQLTVDKEQVLRKRNTQDPTLPKDPPLRLLNNASYELAQQFDVMQNMTFAPAPAYPLEVCAEEDLPIGSSHPKISELVEKMGSAASLAAESRFRGSPEGRRCYSKSTENVTGRSPDAKRRVIETSLLDRIKKNSDQFSLTGEAAASGRSSAVSSPCVPALDDEVDYPCLLENKPLLIMEREAATCTTSETTLNEARTNNNNKSDDEVELGNLSFIGEYYQARGWSGAGVTKSCEDVRSNGGSGPRERLWRLVLERQAAMEKEYRSDGNNAAGSGGGGGTSAAARRLVYPPPPAAPRRPGSPAESAASGGVSGAAGGSSSSSPAAVAEQRRYDQRQQLQQAGEFGGNYEAAEEVSGGVLDGGSGEAEAGTVQPRTPEMSATAAKRLAMSGEPNISRSTSSMNTLNTSSSSIVREEKKKGGLGGFLQRFSRLRFSGRSKVPRSDQIQKKSASASAGGAGVGATSDKPRNDQQQPRSRKNEPDYIIIPLHGPDDERDNGLRDEHRSDGYEQKNIPLPTASQNGRPPVCSGRKPPLPPQSLLRTSSSAGSGGGGGGYNGGSSSFGGYGSAGGSGVGVSGSSRRRAATDLGNPAAIEMAKARAAMLASQDHPQQHHQPHQHGQQQRQLQHGPAQHRPAGLLETDLDAPVDPEEAAGKKARSLLNLNHNGHPPHLLLHHQQRQPPSLSVAGPDQPELDAELLLDYDEDDVSGSEPRPCRQAVNHHHHHHRPKQVSDTAAGHQRPHKSMEFLLDKENLHFVKPPENELQKVGERTPSEHELRVQRSLQRLNVPDWYKNSPAAKDGGGFRLKRHSDASQHGGWRALGSKTTSLSSLSSSSNRQPTAGTLLSPSPTPPVFSRWSTSLLNSAGSSPASSARSSFNHRQPYLGWRSQERLANPRTPAERLAQGILPQLQNANKQQQQQPSGQQQPSAQPGSQTTNQEVRNSIKEVTSAIVHYVQSGQEVTAGGGGGGRLSPRPRGDDWDDGRAGSRSTSPRGSTRLVWMESSFVGVRPVESPSDTPAGIAVPGSASASARPSLVGGLAGAPGGSLAPGACSLASPSRSSLHDSTATTTTLGLGSLRSAGGPGLGGETSEDGSTPGVCGPDDGGFASFSGDSTTDLGPNHLFLDLGQSPPRAAAADEDASGLGLPQDSRHRQRRHRRSEQHSDSGSLQRRERRESPSPTQQQQQSQQQPHEPGKQHQSRHRQRAEPEQHQHRQHEPQQQQHQRGSYEEPQVVTGVGGGGGGAGLAEESILLWNKPSPGSTTLEDVLDSLLGLPSASRTPSPGPTGHHHHHHHHHHQQQPHQHHHHHHHHHHHQHQQQQPQSGQGTPLSSSPSSTRHQ